LSSLKTIRLCQNSLVVTLHKQNLLGFFIDNEMALFAVITLVATVLQYSFLWILIPPLQDWTSSYIMRWGLIIFHGFFFSYLFCYYLTCTKDPGFCPPNWIPKVSKSSLQKARQRCKGYHRADYKMHFRFCSQCKIFKPPRTHHCTICQRYSLSNISGHNRSSDIL
jgi:hypothetical protein